MSFILLLNINAILKNVENQTVAGPMWLTYDSPPPPPPIKVNVVNVTQILQNIFFCVQHKKELQTGLGQHLSE